MHKNGIKHTVTTPYHPQSNGPAEKAIRNVKEALVIQAPVANRWRAIKHRLADFRLRYRTIPHSTTGAVPAELLMKRLRTRLNQVKLDLAKTKECKQNKQKKYMDLKGHQEEMFVDKMTQFKLEILKSVEILKGRFFEWWFYPQTLKGLWTHNLFD